MKSKILEKVLKNRTNYVHALEVENVFELEYVIDTLIREFKEDYTKKDIIKFFVGMTIYYLEPENGHDENEENAVLQFNIEDYINTIFLI